MAKKPFLPLNFIGMAKKPAIAVQASQPFSELLEITF
jgi:hypothetical protein